MEEDSKSKIKPSPWGSPPVADAAGCSDADANTSLTDIMSEQLIDEMDRTKMMPKPVVASSASDLEPDLALAIAASLSDGEDPCAADSTLAALLQQQFDREHNRQLKTEERAYNRDNKVRLSFDNYRVSQPDFEDSEEEEDSDDDCREERCRRVDTDDRTRFNGAGLARRQDGSVVSKHDKDLCGKKNVTRMLMKFPPEFQVGDGPAINMKLSNSVYNSLKIHSQSEQKRRQRVKETKDHSTAEFSLDENTRLILYRLVGSGVLSEITQPISVGKEATIFHAFGGDGQADSSATHAPVGDIPAECAIKVYKTATAEFKNRRDYMEDDFRFKNPRATMKMWAEKETLNLRRMRRFSLPCPSVVLLRKHIVVMSFIGERGKMAPKLKHAQFTPETLALAYSQLKDCIRRLYVDCGLVHSDLSEYNVLWWRDSIQLIDVGQAVDRLHPRALEFLVRDLSIISAFFRNHNHAQSASKRTSFLSNVDLFNHVTGLGIDCPDDSQLTTAVLEYAALQATSNMIVEDKKNPADCELRRAQQDAAAMA